MFVSNRFPIHGKVAVKADGTMDRAAMATITNPDVLNAVEAALQLKDETGCEVVVVTMGPPPAEGMLRELIARGADRGVLVSAVSYTHLSRLVWARTLHARLL